MQFDATDRVFPLKFAAGHCSSFLTVCLLTLSLSGHPCCASATEGSSESDTKIASTIGGAKNGSLSGAQPKSNLVERPKRELFPPMTVETLDQATRELASQLEILPYLQELYGQPHPNAQRTSLLREKIQETILESFFDAQSVSAEADREQARLAILRETLISRRDHSIELNNAGNFIASGALNTIGSVLGFPVRANPVPGNLNQMMGGVVSTGMSMYALKQQAGGKARGEGSPTLLAELFGRPTDFRTDYPESVWRFLHAQSVDQPGKTRAQILEERWIERQYLEPHGSARETSKLDAVCGKGNHKVSIDDLSDEMSMISDVSAVTELMTHHLRDLLRMIDSDVVF